MLFEARHQVFRNGDVPDAARGLGLAVSANRSPVFLYAYGGSPDAHHSTLPVRIDVDVPTLQSVHLLRP